jgi:ABC-type multidrug transport system ATPase subunit
LLDEATSALDKVNEQAVQNAIDRYRRDKGGVTVIAIAHRLSTIKDSDKIVVLKDGVLTEVGNHQELLQNYPNGIYHGFVKKQESAEAEGPEQKKSIKPVVRASTINKKAGMVQGEDSMEIEEEFDEEEKDKLQAVLEHDEIEQEKHKEFERSLEEGVTGRLMPYNNPFWYVYVAIGACIIDGATAPLNGILFSKIVNVLALEIDFDGTNPQGLSIE